MNAHIDCTAGISGDMLLGALIGLGLRRNELEATLKKSIPVAGWSLRVRRVEPHGWPSWSVSVTGDRPFGGAERMLACIRRARVPASVRRTAASVLQDLNQAELTAHGVRKKFASFHPHQLGSVDTLVDILGCVWGFDRLGIAECSATPVGAGRLAPATTRLLSRSKIPWIPLNVSMETVTPTGAALLGRLVRRFRPAAAQSSVRWGHGAGSLNPDSHPNVLSIAALAPAPSRGIDRDDVVLLETVMDDMDPRLYPHAADRCFQEGALDVWWTPVGMKKGRPGIALSVLVPPEREEGVVRTLFLETTTLGIRRSPLERHVLPRATDGRVKIIHRPDGRPVRRTEYEAARIRAGRLSLPLRKLL